MKIHNDIITLSTGKEIEANCGLFSLSPNAGPDSEISTGYDDTVQGSDAAGGALTQAEREEIAEAMAAAWRRWAGK